MIGRQKALLQLTSDEKDQLERWVRRRKSAQGLALRSQIVLSCATGLTNKEVAAQLGVSMPTVGKWRSRFIDSRLDGLVDEPRSGRKPTITAEQVEDVVVATLESTPEHATHWSRKKMAERSGLSKSTIGRIWKGFGLKPHLVDGFKLSNDPLFVDKVYDVVGLYLNPPEAAAVLCVDEKSQVQALGRSQPAFPMMPGMPEKRTHDYVRNGTTSLFAAFNIGERLLSLVLDTDDGRGNRHQGVRRGWWILLMICTITVTRNPAARTNGRSQRCRGPWVIGGATDRRSSARS